MQRPRALGETEIAEHFETVSALLASQAERGVAPWMRSFDGLETPLPRGYATERPVRASACVWLAALAAERGYRDPRWCTAVTARKFGGYIRRGQRGTPVLLWDRSRGPSPSSVARAYMVFNAQQCGGLIEWVPETGAPRWQEQRARRILLGSGARIEVSPEGHARYDLRADRIKLPAEEHLGDPDAYLRIALHELGHWSGHSSRMNRRTLARGVENGYGSSDYAREELRAEIASMLLGDRLELGHDPSRHAHFRSRWTEILRATPKEIDRAARQAEDISSYVLRLGRKRPRSAQEQDAQGPEQAPWRRPERCGPLRGGPEGPSR